MWWPFFISNFVPYYQIQTYRNPINWQIESNRHILFVAGINVQCSCVVVFVLFFVFSFCSSFFASVSGLTDWFGKQILWIVVQFLGANNNMLCLWTQNYSKSKDGKTIKTNSNNNAWKCHQRYVSVDEDETNSVFFFLISYINERTRKIDKCFVLFM